MSGFAGARSYAQDGVQEIVVGPGETLWSIANKYLKDPQKWSEIVRINNLPPDPTLALPGTRIRIPVTLIKDEFRTAKLVEMKSDVRYKRKNETDFKSAAPDMTLRYEDSLRTMQGGEARVKFTAQETIQINENSLVVLRPEKTSQEVQLMQGAVRASHAKVIMPGGTVVHPQTRSSEYQARVRDDESEVVFVYKGEVNVTAQGKTVRVKQGYGTHVPKSAAPLEPAPLKTFSDFNPADMPAVRVVKVVPRSAMKTAPVSTKAAASSESAPKAKSAISKNVLAGYHVQIAKDENFRNIVLEKTDTTGAPFDPKTQSIPDGTYYMRVAFLDMSGGQAPYSEPNMIIKDTVPPDLSVSSPLDGQTFSGPDSYCDVIGRVQGAVILTVNDNNVFTNSDGRFSAVAHFKEGRNDVRVLARDGSGNETVIVRKVNYTK
jgi:mannose-6-phosphate isomerase-like protein (cupin superfamily)